MYILDAFGLDARKLFDEAIRRGSVSDHQLSLILKEEPVDPDQIEDLLAELESLGVRRLED